MVRIIIFRSSDHPNMMGIAEMFAHLDRVTECGRKAGIDYKFSGDDNEWIYWYEFETEEQAALFKLTYL